MKPRLPLPLGPFLPLLLLLINGILCQGLSLSESSSSASLRWHEGILFHRRHVLQRATTIVPSILLSAPSVVHAANARELDFCLVQSARAIAWAQRVSQQLNSAASESQQKAAYLEARLGAKTLLTGRMGGGANAAVYRLSTLQFTGCLHDLVTSYGASAPLIQSWREEIAAVVEFDGLDSVMDASPRSALTLQQYSDSKRMFVTRLLNERVIPTGQRVMQQFPERQPRVQEYLVQYHSDEFVGGSTSIQLDYGRI